MTACNYSKQGEKESENLVRKEIADNSVTNQHDGSYLMQCGNASLKIIRLAQIAATKSTNESIRSLAGDVREVHNTLYDDAGNLGMRKNVSIPVVMSETDKLELEQFTNGTAEEFDAKFCELLLREQNSILEASKRFMDDAKDDDIRAYARLYSGRVDELNEKAMTIARKRSS